MYYFYIDAIPDGKVNNRRIVFHDEGKSKKKVKKRDCKFVRGKGVTKMAWKTVCVFRESRIGHLRLMETCQWNALAKGGSRAEGDVQTHSIEAALVNERGEKEGGGGWVGIKRRLFTGRKGWGWEDSNSHRRLTGHPPPSLLLPISIKTIYHPTSSFPPNPTTTQKPGGWFDAQRERALYASLFFFVTKKKFQVGDPRITLIKKDSTFCLKSIQSSTYMAIQLWKRGNLKVTSKHGSSFPVAAVFTSNNESLERHNPLSFPFQDNTVGGREGTGLNQWF